MPINPMMSSGLAGDSLLTHLNTGGDKKASISNYTGTTFIFSMSEQVSDMLITVLQDYFQATDLTKELNTDLAKVLKEVTVLDQFTSDSVRLPQVVVSSLPADSIPLSLGNRIGQETYEDEIYDVYGGNVILNTTIEMYDSGKPNVHKLADMVFLGLMQYVPMRMGQLKMTMDVAKVRFSNANRITGTNVGGEIYKIPLTIPIISEWRQYMKIETVDTATLISVPTKPST